jgi:hypothetical protein
MPHAKHNCRLKKLFEAAEQRMAFGKKFAGAPRAAACLLIKIRKIKVESGNRSSISAYQNFNPWKSAALKPL